jgi:hypothetical protein
MLIRFIQELKPVTTKQFDVGNPPGRVVQIFNNPDALPVQDPDPQATSDSDQVKFSKIPNDYSFLDMARILNSLGKFIKTGDYQIRQYPGIFGFPINQWMNRIDDWASSEFVLKSSNGAQGVSGARITTPGAEYPEFIFLMKVFFTYLHDQIRQIIHQCMILIFSQIEDFEVAGPQGNVTNPYLEALHYSLKTKPLDDAYMYNLLLPSMPDPSEFTNPKNEFINKLKTQKWTNDTELNTWFRNFAKTIDIPIMQQIYDNYLFDENGDFNKFK